MAGEIDFDIARQLITKLSSPALSQFRLWWNLKHDIEDFQRTVSTIDAVLLDAAEKSVTSNHKVWLEKLKDLLHDADDLLDDFSTEALRKDLMGGNKLTKELTSLEEFEVRDCKELELSAADFQIFQDHTNLHYLTLENIPKCRHLPEWRKNFHNNRRNSPIE